MVLCSSVDSAYQGNSIYLERIVSYFLTVYELELLTITRKVLTL